MDVELEPAPQAVLTADLAVTRGPFTLRARLDVQPGEVLAVLGPNGAGKSTILRALAGLIAVTEGTITVGADLWDDADRDVFVAAADRRVGVVFQDYRLFPHLSVLDNVAFGIRARGTPRRAARGQAGEWLAASALSDLADRRPAELSGGQAQRVALARALAGDPVLLLLDEPLAALDTRTRLETRSELHRHLAGFAGPAVLVTHDPLEALVLADRILVLEEGVVVQTGTPGDVARRPATDYVARLVGLNLYTGTLTDRVSRKIELDCGGTLFAVGPGSRDGQAEVVALAGTRMLVAVSPAAISLHDHAPDAGSARNVWPGRVAALELLTDRVRVAVDGRPDALVDVTAAAVADLALRPGQQVWLSAKATEVAAYPDPGHAPRSGGPAG